MQELPFQSLLARCGLRPAQKLLFRVIKAEARANPFPPPKIPRGTETWTRKEHFLLVEGTFMTTPRIARVRDTVDGSSDRLPGAHLRADRGSRQRLLVPSRTSNPSHGCPVGRAAVGASDALAGQTQLRLRGSALRVIWPVKTPSPSRPQLHCSKS